MNSQPNAQRNRLLVVSCLVFLALGLLTGVIGPILPELAGQTGSSLASLGAVFTALFFGALLAQLAVGFLIDRLGSPPVLVVGLVMIAAGMTAVTASPVLPLTLAAALFAGLGHGAVDVANNLMVAVGFADRRVSALNLLNVFFGLGAVLGPALAGLSIHLWQTALPAVWAGAALGLTQVPLLLRLARHRRPERLSVPEESSGSVYRFPLLWVLGGLLLVYVGIENGLGGWTTTYVAGTTPLSLGSAALVTSGFWLALTVGRVAATLVGHRFSSHALLTLSLGGAVAGGLLLAASTGGALLTIAAVLLLGFSFGPIFPTVLAVITETFHRSPGRAASAVVVMGSIGGMLLPWWQGLVLAGNGARAAAIFVAAAALAMVALYLASQYLSRHAPGAAPAPDL